MTYLNQWVRLALALSVSAGVFACKQDSQLNTTVPPIVTQSIPQPYPASDHAPIEPIIGTYKANSFEEVSSPVSYPINGQTVSLVIKPASGDTVQVSIQATANGKYSPGKDLFYPKAVVVSKTHTDGTVIYYVYLTPPTTTDCGYNTLYIYSNQTIDYNFIPPGNGPCLGARIRFGKE
ncbi:hypothetical protein GO755_39170 [Spirosoma sp. HMF4905]|uniref:Lipoprotein n=1 Tax=Spirosoma arboris TaxID=2682092 RepID=A0A7K1SQM9_9BACT|nr:hypothetical protein [Spirosoma arboris]MVM36101.1 hypothetical protein [Spirosoma arboris]